MPSICDMVVNSVCAYQGQVFVGGFVDPWHDAGLDCVGWSMIGYAYFELDLHNTSGYMKMPGRGECLKVLPLRKGVMAYGTNSIAMFYPVESPAATFGMHEVFGSLGIADRDAVAGDGDMHFFLTPLGELYQIDNNLQPKRLGYRGVLAPHLDESSDVVLTYDGARKHLYVGFSTGCFVYADEQLHERWTVPTLMNHVSGELQTSYEDLSNDGDPAFLVVTDIMDFGIAGIKTIMSLELSGGLASNTWGAISWRNDRAGDWRTTNWVKCSPSGICNVRCAGREFKIHIKGDSTTDVELQYMNVKYLVTDKHNIRGPLNAG